MFSQYKSLAVGFLPVASKLCRPQQASEVSTLSDQAISVMTDLNQVSAVTIAAGDGLMDAEYKMKIRQVKLLFVMDHNEYIIGLVTYTDLVGQRLDDLLSETGMAKDEICILDIMTGIDSIDTVKMESIEQSSVGDIVMTLKELKQQHLLILEKKDGLSRIRGLFSTSQISKQLSINIKEFFFPDSLDDRHTA